METTTKNELHVTGKILKIEEKYSSHDVPFFIVDLETFSGPNIRFQAWGPSYDFIKANNLDYVSEKSMNNSYIEVSGFMHVFQMPTKYNTLQEYTTFKATEIKFPTASVTLQGSISEIMRPDEGYMSNYVAFTFYPDLYVSYNNKLKKVEPISCTMLKEDFEAQFVDCTKNTDYYIITGDVDNSNKKYTKITVRKIQFVDN